MRLARTSAAALAIAVAISFAIIAAALGLLYAQRGLVQRSGVLAEFRRADAAEATGIDWRGYLIVPRRDRYRIVAPADGQVWLDLDGRPVVDAGMSRREVRLELTRGLHPIRIRSTGSAGAQALDFRWARDDGVPVRVPPVLLVPDLVAHDEIQRRILLSQAAPFALPACSLLLLALVAVGARAGLRTIFASGARAWLGPPILWAAVLLLFATGMWWGLPDHGGWAADEVSPAEVAAALESRFAGGWASVYPPFHYAVLAAATAPYHAASALDLAELADVGALTQMLLVGRGVSVLMALGIVVLVFGLTREIASPRAAWLASAAVATTLPIAYYAKTANVDVPSVFWLTLSLVFFARTVTRGRPLDFYLFAAAGAAAIGTKDQNYGYFVLPAVYMLLGRLRGSTTRPGVPRLRVLAGMAAIAAVGLLLVYNVPFNPSGFAEHVRIITGGRSQGYRMYPGTLSGQARLLGTTFVDLGQAMGWPLLVASVWGVVAAFRAGVTSIRWLMLPVTSYYLTLIAVVGYHYDRFLLGVAVVLGVCAGWWLDRWLRDGATWRPVRTAVVVIALAYGITRVVALDVLMLKDSRYEVEDWLVDRAGPGDRVAAAGLGTYLPRESRVFWSPIDQDMGTLEREKPAFVVINAAYSRRYEPGSEPHAFYEALRSGTAGYTRVLRHRTELWWSPLNFERRFREGLEDQFSNLTKVNPPIEVYRRIQPAP